LVAAVFVGLILVMPVAMLAVFGRPAGADPVSECAPGATDPTLPANLGAPGQLGGIAGTGITAQDLADVRRSRHASSRITPGDYVSTSYGPPWGGIQGEGNATSGGLRIGGGAPRKYFIAVDPDLIGHATWVYLWPNPYNWSGPFLAADTGGAIVDRRIDFYDWRGRSAQLGWGRRVVRASATPLVPGVAPSLISAGPAGDTGTAAGGCATTPISVSAGSGWGGAGGEVVTPAWANAPGRPLQPVLLEFMAGVAGRAGRRVVISTGTRHSKFTTSGKVSDHWYGLAADMGAGANGFPINGEGGTVIAAAALATAGVPADSARRIAEGGGAHSVCSTAPNATRWRVQVLWRTYTGGDHYDHVHVGLRQGCAFAGVRTSR
jgi:3D (Asp-Asp-Asp) domain-containing protein